MSDFVIDVSTIFRREWLRYRRERMFLLAQILLPVLGVVFIGLPVGEIRPGVDYAGYLASGLMMFVISSAAIGGGYTLLEDVHQGFLRPILVAPVSRSSIVVGKILARMLISLGLVIVMVPIFTLFTDIHLAHPLLAVGALVGLTFGFVAFGIIVATWLRHLETFRTLTIFITFPIYLLSGLFFPVEQLPGAIQTLALLNPFTYGVDLFRYGLIDMHEFPQMTSALILGAFAVLSTFVAAVAFERRLAS